MLRFRRGDLTGFGILAIVYTVAYCSLAGFDRPLDTVSFILGFPDWVFWGVIAPWGACTLVSCYFSYVLMQDHDLEIESALCQPPNASESSPGEDSDA